MKPVPRHVMLGLPTYTGQLHVATMRTIMDACAHLSRAGDRVSLIDTCSGADICDNRNVMAAHLLASDATHLMFIDADVSSQQGAIPRLLNYGVDFVAAVYPKRQDPIMFPMRYLDGHDGPVEAGIKGLLEVAGVAGGFVCVTRSMIRRMVRRHRDKEYLSHHAPGGKAWALFDHYWHRDEHGQHRLSEDYAFCRRWRDIGGRVLIDPEILLGHTGHKEFAGRLTDYLKPKDVSHGDDAGHRERGSEAHPGNGRGGDADRAVLG